MSESLQLSAANVRVVTEPAVRSALERTLSEWIVGRRWFGSKARSVASLAIGDVVPLDERHALVLADIAYQQGDPEEYLLPLGLAVGEAAGAIEADRPGSVICQVRFSAEDQTGVLYDAIADAQVTGAWLKLIADERELAGRQGGLVCRRTAHFAALRGPADLPLQSSLLAGEQSNSSVLFGERLILKLFRRPERGINPDVEMTGYLTERTGFRHVPIVAGTVEYRRAGQPPRSLAVLQGYVANRGVAWEHTLDALSEFFQRVLALPASAAADPALRAPGTLVDRAARGVPAAAREAIGRFLGEAELLGRRTGELHLALAGPTDESDFAPEPLGPAFQRELLASADTLARRTFEMLRAALTQLSAGVRPRAQRLLECEAAILGRFDALSQGALGGLRIRVHGDYHLGQVLYTGDDFVIIDFEGEPARPLAERRIKTSALRDVAGMLRSFDYAAHSALAALGESHAGRPPAAADWARLWNDWTGAAYLAAYLETVGRSELLPKSPVDVQRLLDVLLVEKAVYELQYELNNRPTWVPIPLEALLAIAARPE